MATVFLSYSRKDHYFAELADIKLSEAGIKLWRDQGQLRPGSDWRFGIERGIASSIAVIVALSENSADSSYVTFEWAYAMGKRKPVVPLRLQNCTVHPKLEPIQHLDFSVPWSLPWPALIAERGAVCSIGVYWARLKVISCGPFPRPPPASMVSFNSSPASVPL